MISYPLTASQLDAYLGQPDQITSLLQTVSQLSPLSVPTVKPTGPQDDSAAARHYRQLALEGLDVLSSGT